MQHIVHTVGIQNQTSFIVSVETVVRRGLFQFDIIGLADKTISESKQRILSAISHTETQKKGSSNKKITTLLSPADVKKEGSYFDLPIAVSYILAKLSKDTQRDTRGTLDNVSSGKYILENKIIILGELTLTGSIISVRNICSLITASVEKGILNFIIPKENEGDIAHIGGIAIWGVQHISTILDALGNRNVYDKNVRDKDVYDKDVYDKDVYDKSSALNDCFEKYSRKIFTSTNTLDKTERERVYSIDLIEGNLVSKRALHIALAGKHNILFIGQPGTGKSMLAKSAEELIPYITRDGMNSIQQKVCTTSYIRPFREPHHTSSYTEIIGNKFTEGELSLSHNGILFLDELSEFNKRVLEGLRQPIENKYIQINSTSEYIIPTDFILIGCMNPCDCGNFKSEKKQCTCTQSQLEKYKRKMNSPLLQRFDLIIFVGQKLRDIKITPKFQVNLGTTLGHQANLNGSTIQKSVERIRCIQSERTLHVFEENFAHVQNTQNIPKLTDEKDKGVKNQSIHIYNKKIKTILAKSYIESLDNQTLKLFKDIVSRYNFSKREETSLILLSRTIADIDSLEKKGWVGENVANQTEKASPILERHILEAVSYKKRDAK